MTTAMTSERTMTAKFAGTCRSCGSAIAPGLTITWSKEGGARHQSCSGQASAPAARPMSSRQAYLAGRRGMYSRGMGSGHGVAAPVAGYSRYCTDNAACGCFDCAS